MQTATSETESKSLYLSICVHHYTLRAPCPKGQGNCKNLSHRREHGSEPAVRTARHTAPLFLVVFGYSARTWRPTAPLEGQGARGRGPHGVSGVTTTDTESATSVFSCHVGRRTSPGTRLLSVHSGASVAMAQSHWRWAPAPPPRRAQSSGSRPAAASLRTVARRPCSSRRPMPSTLHTNVALLRGPRQPGVSVRPPHSGCPNGNTTNGRARSTCGALSVDTAQHHAAPPRRMVRDAACVGSGSRLLAQERARPCWPSDP